jgi:hypothetical protein
MAFFDSSMSVVTPNQVAKGSRHKDSDGHSGHRPVQIEEDVQENGAAMKPTGGAPVDVMEVVESPRATISWQVVRVVMRGS